MHKETRIVVAGCGAMGLPMAQALLEAGYPTNGYDIRPAGEFGEFAAHMLDDLDNLPHDTVLMIVVRDARQIMDVCFDQQAAFTGENYPGTLIISSTVAPSVVSQVAEKLPDDVTLIDAPMSGAHYSAQQKTLTFMLGGESNRINELMPVFQTMGERIFHIGGCGQGMLAKVLNNYVTASCVVAVRRSLAHADALGMEYRSLLEVMRESSGANWFADNLDRLNWGAEIYEPGNTIGILEKDVFAALDAINTLECDTAYETKLPEMLRQLPALPQTR